MAKSDPPTVPEKPLHIHAENSRTYLEIRPTADPVSAETAITNFRQLHRIAGTTESSRIAALVSRASVPPTIECLLISNGEGDTIKYRIGTDDGYIDALERVLRALFPDSFEIDRVLESSDHLERRRDSKTAIHAVEFVGRTDRRTDWQTRLKAFDELRDDVDHSLPLSSVIETMASTDIPIVYQALIRPKSDWTAQAEEHRRAIVESKATLGDALLSALWGPPDGDYMLPQSEQVRLDEIDERETRRSFEVAARAVALGDAEAGQACYELASAFASISHTTYEVEGEISDAQDAETVFNNVCARRIEPPSFERVATRLPWLANRSPTIVADTREIPSFCILTGDALNVAGARAVAPTPGERTAVPRPPLELLKRYRGRGLVLGNPVTQDGTPDTQPVTLPPALQPLHVAWFGKTGSGKSTALTNAILANHDATDGLDILIDPKGDGMPVDYLRAHYATYGTLENVRYFDCSTVLPAFSFFDIRDDLEAGVSRTTAVEETADHYLEILTQIMGRERFEQAVRSPDVIRYLVKAMFDPVSGEDAFAHRDLHSAVRQMHERQTAPAVADEDLERMLAGVVANRSRTFDEIMQGIANRIEKIPVDSRLATVFNHVPDDTDPHFDLEASLDEDVVIIIDTGGLRSEAQRVLTLLILSNLWTALRRRTRKSDEELPLVNLYIEEASSVAVSDLLQQLLSQSRGFGCSVTLSMQFPGQLRGQHETAYDEVLNNISTFVTGNVPIDRRLAARLATDEMEPQAIGNRLRALRRGQWLVSLPAAFDEPEPRPFIVGSVAPPPGNPAGPHPLTSANERVFQRALDTVCDQTRAEAGLTLTSPNTVEAPESDDPGPTRVDSALPYTNRMPPSVKYHHDGHLLGCRHCDSLFDPDIGGMQAAIECCSTLEETDRADIPICDMNIKLTPSEREQSRYSDAQLMFVQAVYNAMQGRYSRLEYDIVHDSMIRLQEYVGVDSQKIMDLIDDGVLTSDTDRPHRLYSVSPEGRSVIGERYRKGSEYGHGKGDLEETSEHILGVEVVRRWLERTKRNDPDSAVETVIPYFDLEERDGPTVPISEAMASDENALEEAHDDYDHRRLDVACLDADGNIEIAIEVERINNDARRAIPADYDKMAECEPREAIWVAMSHSQAHKILEALNDPLDGEPRVEKTYAQGTPANHFKLNTEGCTQMYTVEQIRERLSHLTENPVN